MSNFYRYQSDASMLINLDTPDVELLRERQRVLQEKIAKLSIDLAVVTDTITSRD